LVDFSDYLSDEYNLINFSVDYLPYKKEKNTNEKSKVVEGSQWEARVLVVAIEKEKQDYHDHTGFAVFPKIKTETHHNFLLLCFSPSPDHANNGPLLELQSRTLIKGENCNFHTVEGLQNNEVLLLCARCGYSPPAGLAALAGKKKQSDQDLWPNCTKNARIYDRITGELKREFVFGDGISDAQATSTGYIWTGYFDEGVYGNFGWGDWNNETGYSSPPIGSCGLICWDAQTGNRLYRYGGDVSDMYAMNCISDDELWIYYYTAFPLARLKVVGRISQEKYEEEDRRDLELREKWNRYQDILLRKRQAGSEDEWDKKKEDQQPEKSDDTGVTSIEIKEQNDTNKKEKKHDEEEQQLEEVEPPWARPRPSILQVEETQWTKLPHHGSNTIVIGEERPKWRGGGRTVLIRGGYDQRSHFFLMTLGPPGSNKIRQRQEVIFHLDDTEMQNNDAVRVRGPYMLFKRDNMLYGADIREMENALGSSVLPSLKWLCACAVIEHNSTLENLPINKDLSDYLLKVRSELLFEDIPLPEKDNDDD